MQSRHIGLTLAATAAILAARAASADACSLHGTVDKVTYWDDTSTYNPSFFGDTRCSIGGFPLTQTCRLQGFYIVPTGAPAGKLPTIVFVHGSGSTMPQSYCETINAFTDRGFIVFAPVMRGVNGSASPGGSFSNTGAYIEDWASANANSSCDVVCKTTYYMKQESIDLDSAFHYLVDKRPNRTDLTKVALMGHSYGGATVTIADGNSFLTYTPTVTISLSGAAMSWRPDNNWAPAMHDAAAHHRSPIYFQRVANETDIAPDLGSALDPYVAASQAGGGARLAAYSSYAPINTSMCNDFDWHNVHCAFVFEAQGVSIWSDGVAKFLADYGMKP